MVYLGQMDSSEEKSAILAALEEHKGIVSVACKSIGLARSTFYNWMAADAEFKAAVDEIHEVAIDYVESKLFEKISGVQVQRGTNDDGDPIIYDQPPSDTAIIFYLKTRAKKRGYIEKSELGFTDNEGNDVPVQIFQIPDNKRDQQP
jgi:hypothetical protein